MGVIREAREAMADNVIWSNPKIERQQRSLLFGHPSFSIWLTGLSGSGKSTLAREVERKLYSLGMHTVILDGDNLRHGLCKDLDFSENGRMENIRRIGEVAKLFVEAGMVTLVSAISPYRQARNETRRLFESGSFIEVYVRCSMNTCMKRDPKGLYQRIKSERIKGFTGIDSPYEEPLQPELIIDTEVMSVEESVAAIINYLQDCHKIR